jgi:thiosulfate dehydrogenase
MRKTLLGWIILVFIAAMGYAGDIQYLGTMPCTEKVAPSLSGSRIFKLCDGQTKVLLEVSGVSPGVRLNRSQAQQVANILWEKYQNMKMEQKSLTEKRLLYAHGGDTHKRREKMIWNQELKRAIDRGYKLFHDPELGTNGISCDMCHPDASNTHPETYPKFQTQLKKVALLRDMINWCIMNPLEGSRLQDDDPRMKALEAYILSTRKGKVLEPGKH